MFRTHRLFKIVIALSVGGWLVGAPAPAAAETSYHKLKVRLRRLERKTGAVLGTTGEVLLDAAAIFGAALIDGALDSDTCSGSIEVGGRHDGGASKHEAPSKPEHPAPKKYREEQHK